jgi:hypothetical protein
MCSSIREAFPRLRSGDLQEKPTVILQAHRCHFIAMIRLCNMVNLRSRIPAVRYAAFTLLPAGAGTRRIEKSASVSGWSECALRDEGQE